MKLTSLFVFLFLGICCELSISSSANIREKRDLKDFIANANELLSKASRVVAELTLENRTQEAQTIESLANTTKSLVEKLNATTNTTEAFHLLALLDTSEDKLLMAIESAGQLSDGFYVLSLRLMFSGEQIIERANQELESLRQQNKTNSVLLIENSVKLINESVYELSNAKLTLEAYLTELKLIRQLTQLEIYLFELGVGLDLAEFRESLLKKAPVLVKLLTAAINQLKTDEHLGEKRRNETITSFESDIPLLTNLTSHLSNATDNKTIAELTFKLYETELQLEVQLAILSLKIVTKQEVQAMLHRIQELSSKVLVAQKKMVEEHKNTEAEALSDELLVLNDYEIAIRNTVYPLDFLYFEFRFYEIELRINNKLRAANV